MDSLLLVLRVGVSLAVVLGLMWAVSRALRHRGGTRAVPLEVVSRAPLGRKSSVAVVRVADGRGMVVGVTDHQVTFLGEVDLPTAPEAAPERRETIALPKTATPAPRAAAVVALPGGAGAVPADPALGSSKLAGSILAPATWKQATAALREKTVRQ